MTPPIKQEFRVVMQDKRKPGVRYFSRKDSHGDWHCGGCRARRPLVIDIPSECVKCGAFIISIETIGDSVVQIHRYLRPT